MTNPFIHIVTHGKVKRCWHEMVGTNIDSETCSCGRVLVGVQVCRPNPTPTLDFLVQRCEEEGFIFELFMRHVRSDDKKYRASVQPGMFGTFYDEFADTPQEALTLALARALGWEG